MSKRALAVLCGQALLLLIVAATSGCPLAGVGGQAACLACHDGSRAQNMSGIMFSAHGRLACTVCHQNTSLHMSSGGQVTALINPASGSFSQAYSACASCHRDTVNQFLQSGHAEQRRVACHDCHNVHRNRHLVATAESNRVCTQCHTFLGFGTNENITNHTRHPVDPAGTGASRCTACHMPPNTRTNQAQASHGHSLVTIPPSTSAAATPAPLNSCAGIDGCHDGSVANAPVFDVDNATQMQGIQQVVDLWFPAS